MPRGNFFSITAEDITNRYLRQDQFLNRYASGQLVGTAGETYGAASLGINTTTVTITGYPIPTICRGFDWKCVSRCEFTIGSLKTNGTIWAWGCGIYGLTGTGSTLTRLTPVQIGTSTDWKCIHIGHCTAYAIKRDGTLWEWGGVLLNQAATVTRSSPVQIATNNRWRCITSSKNDTMYAMDECGVWYSWGCNRCLALGTGCTNTSALAGCAPICDVFCGEGVPLQCINRFRCVVGTCAGALAIGCDARLYAWGSSGTQGLAWPDPFCSTDCYPCPIDVDFCVFAGEGWAQIATNGFNNGAGITQAGALITWGCNSTTCFSAQLGSGDGNNCHAYIVCEGSFDWSCVALNRTNTIASKKDGSLWVWGNQYLSRMGTGTITGVISTPIQVLTSFSGWKSLNVDYEGWSGIAIL
jgi:hypothetical protein